MDAPAPGGKRLSFFERYLSLWVALCIVVGVAIGTGAPGLVAPLSRLEVSRVNLPIAVLIWLMIYPMMLRIDFTALRGVGRRPKGLLIVLFVNWLVKPFSMAFLGWLFFKHLFAGLIGPALGETSISRARSSWPRRRARRWCSSGVTLPTATRPTRWSRLPSTT